jgi:hypothetical protein
VRCRSRLFAALAIAAIALGTVCASGGGASAGWFNIFDNSTRMALAPIVGAPPNITDQLTQALVAAGKDRKLTLTPGTASAPYTLRGYLVASIEKKGAKISYIWDITDPKGGRVGRVSGDEVIATRTGDDPWSGVDSGVLNSIAGKTASQVAATLAQGRGGTPAPATSGPPGGGSPAAVSSGPPGGGSQSKPAGNSTAVADTPPGEVLALVAPVAGAPGDGQTSLTAALKKQLSSGGVKLANAPSRSVYTVKGTVTMADLAGGKQSIHIDWLVLAPGGKRLGTVSQQNTIPKGSLNGPWGAIADAAAVKAASDIIKLLPRPSG